jgi:hypothetical protein
MTISYSEHNKIEGAKKLSFREYKRFLKDQARLNHYDKSGFFSIKEKAGMNAKYMTYMNRELLKHTQYMARRYLK